MMADIWPTTENIWTIIKQRFYEREITNLDSPNLNIKNIWWELDSDSESIPRPLAAAITNREEQVYKENYQNKVLF